MSLPDRRMYPDTTVNKLRRQIKILKLKLIIARNEWNPKKENVGLAAQIATSDAEAKLAKMKLTKAEEDL